MTRWDAGRVADWYARAGCICGFTTWGVTDRYTWIRDFFGVEGAPLLLDESYGLKPAYLGVRQALEEALRERAGGP